MVSLAKDRPLALLRGLVWDWSGWSRPYGAVPLRTRTYANTSNTWPQSSTLASSGVKPAIREPAWSCTPVAAGSSAVGTSVPSWGACPPCRHLGYSKLRLLTVNYGLGLGRSRPRRRSRFARSPLCHVPGETRTGHTDGCPSTSLHRRHTLSLVRSWSLCAALHRSGRCWPGWWASSPGLPGLWPLAAGGVPGFDPGIGRAECRYMP